MKVTPRLVVVGLVCYLLGGGLIKYCPYQQIWWVANMAQDFGSGLLGLLGITNLGRMRAILELLSESEKTRSSGEVQRSDPPPPSS